MSPKAWRFICFLSDYGLADELVGVCHGVIARIAPGVRVIDLSHGVRPHDVSGGAMVLASSVKHLPDGILLAVVDPGVGSERLAVVVEASDGRLLVGPDNGLLMPAARRMGGVVRAWQIQNPALVAPRPSPTFHGRDIFAPAAAHLCLGTPPEELGPQIPPGSLVDLTLPTPRRHGDHFHGVVLGVDRFGNLQTDLVSADLAALGLGPGGICNVQAGGRRTTVSFGMTFASVAGGLPVLIEDSSGMLALAVNLGSAAEHFGLSEGSEVIVGGPGAAIEEAEEGDLSG